MKSLLLACLSFIILGAKTCNLKVNVSPTLSVQEEKLLDVAKDSFQAETVKILRVEEGDTIVQRSLHIILINCKRITLEDTLLKIYSESLLGRLLAASNYEKKYNEVEIGFEEKNGWWFYNQSEERSSVFKQEQMDELIDHQLGHGAMLVRRITFLQKNERFRELILIGDSLIKADTSLACLGQQARGIGYLNSGDSIKALKCFLLARQIEPDIAANYENLALVYHNLKNNKLAIFNMDTAIALEPQNGEFHYLRGAYYHDEGIDSSACADEDKALALGYSAASKYSLLYCK